MRDELETGTDCYIDPSSSSPIAALLSHLGWVAQPWGPQSHQFASWFSRSILSPTDSSRPGHLVILLSNDLPASAVLPLIYTGASLDWWLGRGSIYNTQTIVKRSNLYTNIYIYVRVCVCVCVRLNERNCDNPNLTEYLAFFVMLMIYNANTFWSWRIDIYPCLLPGRIWYKFFFIYSGNLGEKEAAQ